MKQQQLKACDPTTGEGKNTAAWRLLSFTPKDYCGQYDRWLLHFSSRWPWNEGSWLSCIETITRGFTSAPQLARRVRHTTTAHGLRCAARRHCCPATTWPCHCLHCLPCVGELKFSFLGSYSTSRFPEWNSELWLCVFGGGVFSLACHYRTVWRIGGLW